MPAYPNLILTTAAGKSLLAGSLSPDGTEINFSNPVPGGTVTGQYEVAGANIGEYQFSTTGPAGTSTVIEFIDGALGNNKSYQARPEDTLEVTYQYSLFDSYPWRRGLLAGGEIQDVEEIGTPISGFDKDTLLDFVTVFNEAGILTTITVVSQGPEDIGYVILAPSTNSGLGQAGLALPAGTIPTLDLVTTVNQGPLSTVVTSQGVNLYGQVYSVGSILGILVADQGKFWTESLTSGLVGWLHLGEHPSQPYLLTDYSDFSLSESDYETGAFSSNYSLANRTWDNFAGWNLTLSAQSANPAGFFQINKVRIQGLNFTMSVWLKAQPSAAVASNLEIITFGPVTLAISGSSSKSAQFFLYSPSGVLQLAGQSMNLSAENFTSLNLIVQELDFPLAIRVNLCSTALVTNLAGLQEIDGILLKSGMTVLLTGQADQTQNGHYLVAEESWCRTAVVLNFDERLAWYNVLSGQNNSGYYQCQNNSISRILYGTDNIQYSHFNCSWTIPGQSPESGYLFVRSFNDLDSLLTVTAGNGTGSSDVSFFDLRFWTVAKTLSDIELITNPQFKALDVASKPTFCSSTRGDLRTLQVLPSGYVFPSVISINFYRQSLSVVTRYNSLGEYVGPNEHEVIGLGDDEITVSPLPLGQVGCTLASQGTGIAAASGGYMGESSLGNPGSLNPDNSGLKYIYVLGENGNMYEVRLSIVRNSNVDTASLVASLASRYSLTQSQTTQELVVQSREITNSLDLPGYYGIKLGDDSGLVVKNEFNQGPEFKIQNIGGRLAIVLVNGIPTVAQLTGGTEVTGPVSLYSSFVEMLSYSLTNNFTAWKNSPNLLTYSYPVPTLAASGPIVFNGTANSLPAGVYQIVIDAAEFGSLPESFSGYNVEVGLIGYSTLTGQSTYSSSQIASVLDPVGNSSFFVIYAGGSTPTISLSARLATCTVSDLQNAICEAFPGGALVLTQTSSPARSSAQAGPFWVQFTAVGAQVPLQFQTSPNFTVSVIREVPGDGSTQEIQKIIFNRPQTVIEIVTSQDLPVDSTTNWVVQIYWNNAALGSRLGIISLNVFKMETQLWTLQLS